MEPATAASNEYIRVDYLIEEVNSQWVRSMLFSGVDCSLGSSRKSPSLLGLKELGFLQG